MTTAFSSCRRGRALLLLLTLGLLTPGLRAEGPITVFAAASLREALESQAKAYAAEGHRAPRLVFAASSTLARQLAAGAEAQLFLSADIRWMASLAEARPLSSAPLLGNRLALLTRKGSQPPCEAPEPCLRALPERLGAHGRLALGDPQHVPAGRYGQAALNYYELLPALKGRLLPADSVRTALAWVTRGEAPLGLGYASDAHVLPALETLAVIPAETHPPIIYPLGRLLDAPQQGEAQAFETFLRSPRARAAWEEAGFTLLASPRRS